ncbi:MAG: alpha-amylase family glycosyl hydrolase [Bacteroidales bacterium]|nr:alpha-amylase family glycosyl hydrolase [Bacteroidales bacterium]
MKIYFISSLLASLVFCSCSNKTEEPLPSNEKMVVYQMIPRIYGNDNLTNKFAGTYAENGSGKMNDVTPEALASIKELGVTHVWYTGILQQGTKTDWSEYGVPRQNPDIIKGEAGSPYAISDYYGVNCELAVDPAKRMEEFEALVKRTHEAGMKVMLDFIPNHVAREYKSVMGVAEDFGASDDVTKAFDPQNNFYYMPGQELDMSNILNKTTYKESPAKASGNDVFTNKPSVDDWYETIKLNYGVDYTDGSKHFDPIPSTWNKMVDILKYWAAKGVDGFRCDMVFMVPVEFWNYAIAAVKADYPNQVFVAEIYDPTIYVSYVEEGGFDYLYDKVELYDTIRTVVDGRRPASIIASVFDLPTYKSSAATHMLNFLENHDEQRIASDFFGKSAQAGIPALAVSALCNSNPFMIYYAQELGEESMDAEGFQGADGRTTIFDYWGLKKLKDFRAVGYDGSKLAPEIKTIRDQYIKLMKVATTSDAALNGEFIDLYKYNKENPCLNTDVVYAFARKSAKETMIVAANFSDEPQTVEIKTGDITKDGVVKGVIEPYNYILIVE